MDVLNSMSAEAAFAGEDISKTLQNAMDSINFDPDITYDEIDLADADMTDASVTGYVTFPTTTMGPDGFPIPGDPIRVPLESYEAAKANGATTIKVPRINGKGTTSKGGVSSGASTGHKGGGGGGRRGGGGGRGREFRKIDRTEKDEKQKKKVEDEIERYHKVRNELQDIEKELSLIGKAKDRAFGRNKIRQIDAETASLKKQSET
ncbi:MAG: hypothetical protein J6I85_05815 [Clostridia bacterium]|nr:hypothetical protein [Clostridia bacterium]